MIRKLCLLLMALQAMWAPVARAQDKNKKKAAPVVAVFLVENRGSPLSAE